MGLDELFGRKKEEKPAEGAAAQHEQTDALEKLETQAAYYRRIISRYAALVNENEEKTVPELKALVDKNTETVQQLKAQALEQTAANKKASGTLPEGWRYDYEKDFLFAAGPAFAIVRGIRQVHSEVSVSFWLSQKEILEVGAADVFDKALLLCSLLQALGAQAKVLVLELENNTIHPVTVLEYSGRAYLLDASQRESQLTTYCGEQEEVLKGFSFGGAKFLKKSYEFDANNYKEFEAADSGTN
ncbi:MAG: hypothetical protein V1708_03580 [Candidatus Micrarchaeota archaeon]